MTGRSRLLLWPELIVEDLNRFLRGWAGYFRYGNSARVLGQIRNYALVWLASWLSKTGPLTAETAPVPDPPQLLPDQGIVSG
jgi:RNA-directed DNA polymerase